MKKTNDHHKIHHPPPAFGGYAFPEENRSAERWIATLILLLVVLLTGSDVIIDFRSGASSSHLLTEAAVILMGSAGIALMWRTALFWRKRTAALAAELTHARSEATEWKATAKRHLEGLGAEIERQFDHWNLTAAEKEVGLLLLKGLSLQEIADLRKVSERTVRQQAQAVYQKANLKSRTGLSAFFLEDLLLPSQAAKK